jgi:hypothetical protein
MTSRSAYSFLKGLAITDSIYRSLPVVHGHSMPFDPSRFVVAG